MFSRLNPYGIYVSWLNSNLCWLNHHFQHVLPVKSLYKSCQLILIHLKSHWIILNHTKSPLSMVKSPPVCSVCSPQALATSPSTRPSSVAPWVCASWPGGIAGGCRGTTWQIGWRMPVMDPKPNRRWGWGWRGGLKNLEFDEMWNLHGIDMFFFFFVGIWY